MVWNVLTDFIWTQFQNLKPCQQTLDCTELFNFYACFMWSFLSVLASCLLDLDVKKTKSWIWFSSFLKPFSLKIIILAIEIMLEHIFPNSILSHWFSIRMFPNHPRLSGDPFFGNDDNLLIDARVHTVEKSHPT